MKKKIFYCISVFLLSLIIFFSFGLKVNANNQNSSVILDIDDRQTNYLVLFTTNIGYNATGVSYDFIRQKWNEGSDFFNVVEYKLLNNGSGEYRIIDNYNNYYASLYDDGFYLLIYSGYDTKINIYEIYVDYDPQTSRTFLPLNSSSLIISLNTQWTGGHYSDYQNKQLYVYGQLLSTITTGVFNPPDYLRDYSNINSLLNQTTYTINNNAFNEAVKGQGGYYQGYNAGYSVGYDAGAEGETAISPVFNILSHIFDIIGSIFAIELVPHIPLGLFILIPIFFAVVGVILFFWRRNS